MKNEKAKKKLILILANIGTASVEKTGQSISYETGDEGYYRKGEYGGKSDSSDSHFFAFFLKMQYLTCDSLIIHDFFVCHNIWDSTNLTKFSNLGIFFKFQ